MQELASGQVVAARFELARPLATGHDARTWLARDTGSRREFVLRFHDTAAVQDGSRLLASIRHPALLAPLETLTVGDRPVDVFEYLDGGEIGRWRGRPWSSIVRGLLPVADALAAVHEAGFVHGDVKAANVLLGADGRARLADFGSARRVGSSRPAAGSPYSLSPERLDGAAAAPSDDVYAFGVLLYELVSGHPPFYPDLTPDRVRSEVPPPLAGRPAPPAALCALVARCLAKRPVERPASMRELCAELERCLAAEPDAAHAAPAAAWMPRPPADTAPIRPQWQRSTASAPSAGELRREGFRRGLLVGGALLAAVAFAFTFFVLPDLVAAKRPVVTTTRTPATAPVAEAAAPAADLERLAEQKQLAEQRRAALAPRLQALERRDVANWAATDLARLRADLAAVDSALEARQFAVALTRLDTVGAGLTALEQRLPKVVQERLAVAQAAFAAGRSAEAAAAFSAVLAADPTNAAAQRGSERSRVLDAVLRETATGARAEQAGDVAAATGAYRRALQLDPATAAAREGLARLQARASGDAFAAAVAQAQSALARRDYPAAQAAYERANRIRPGAPEVTEGLQQVQRAAETRTLASTLERAAAAERAERWSEALALHREALKADSTLRTAQEGVERTEPRAMLDAELQSFLDRPDRFFNAAGRDVARNVIERAATVAPPGPRLQAQLARMRDLLRQAETPIRVTLASDNATEVQIYRIGKLGLFEHRDLELMPGRYTVVGTRQGYRDVRKELNVLPGAPPPELVVRCEEPI
jgi:eukaryotic-like serine/threonine-protein kinase